MIVSFPFFIASLLPMTENIQDAPKVRCTLEMKQWCLTPFLSKIEINSKNGTVNWRFGDHNGYFTIAEDVSCRESSSQSPWAAREIFENSKLVGFNISNTTCKMLIKFDGMGSNSQSYKRYIKYGIILHKGNESVSVSKIVGDAF